MVCANLHTHMHEVLPDATQPHRLVQLGVYTDIRSPHLLLSKLPDSLNRTWRTPLEASVWQKSNRRHTCRGCMEEQMRALNGTIRRSRSPPRIRHSIQPNVTAHMPWMYLWRWTVYSRVTTSLRAERFLSDFGGIWTRKETLWLSPEQLVVMHSHFQGRINWNLLSPIEEQQSMIQRGPLRDSSQCACAKARAWIASIERAPTVYE